MSPPASVDGIRSARSMQAVAREASPWRKLFTHRRQHWITLVLEELEGRHFELLASRPAAAKRATWLLSYRDLFRQLADGKYAPAFHAYLAKCPVEMTPLGVWLLSRCGDRCNLRGLGDFANHSSEAVRRHVARALRRLEAWPELAAMAKVYPGNDRIQWYANASIIKRSHEERLRSLAQIMDHSNAPAAAGPSHMPLWFRDLDWLRRPPKSIEYIRTLLARIHRLVHGP